MKRFFTVVLFSMITSTVGPLATAQSALPATLGYCWYAAGLAWVPMAAGKALLPARALAQSWYRMRTMSPLPM